MKKQIKVLAVLSTAMFMAAVTPNLVGTASTAYAKTAGWTEENGNQYYYDSYGEATTDIWKKNGNDWYYLDSDGIRVADRQIDEYCVGEDGKRVNMKWVSAENEDFWDEDDAPELLYYYHGRNGKALTSRRASISRSWYYFNEGGIMQAGSITVGGYNYYLGEDGSRKTGWIFLADEIDDPEYVESWHYFDSMGKCIENEVDKKIEGQYYTFVDGRIQTSWYKLPVQTAAESGEVQAATPSETVPVSEQTAAGYQYYDEDRERAPGWRTIEGIEGLSEEAELYRFYFKNDKPYYAERDLELFTTESGRYAFNTKGEVQTGKKVVNPEDGNVANFYFDEEGVMRTGKQVIFNEDLSETQNWYFHTDGPRKGQGSHGIKDNVLYVCGLCQEVDKDLRFALAELNGNQYSVNSNGAIQKVTSSSKSNAMPGLSSGYKDFKDESDKVWIVNIEGVIQTQSIAQQQIHSNHKAVSVSARLTDGPRQTNQLVCRFFVQFDELTKIAKKSGIFCDLKRYIY